MNASDGNEGIELTQRQKAALLRALVGTLSAITATNAVHAGTRKVLIELIYGDTRGATKTLIKALDDDKTQEAIDAVVEAVKELMTTMGVAEL